MAQQKKPKRDNRRIIMAVLAGLMALLMLLPMLSMILPTASAATTDQLRGDISSLQGDASKIAARLKELEAQLKDIQGDKSQALGQKRILDDQVSAKEEEIRNTQAQIDKYAALIAEQELVLEETRDKEARQYELFCQRVRAMEETGTVSYWAILFSSADFSDLLDRATFVSEVMEYDNAVMDELAETRRQIEALMAELTAAQEAQQAQKDTLVLQKQDLDAKLADAAALVKKIQSQEAEYQSSKAQLEREEKEVEALIAKKSKELQAKIAAGQISFDPGTGWQWPMPGNVTVTSTYGPRIHPITGRAGNHTGTDIAAPRGTPILSARGGVVTISTYNNSYGNYVVVDHGGGIATLYAHMSSRTVKEGQVVSQGQELGKVGSTGSSTGNHLHYELRIDGKRADVLAKYPGITFIYR